MSAITPDLVASWTAAPVAVGSFTAVYDAWFRRVVQWLRAFGVPSSELEDQAQEVFVVVQRRLVDFDGQNLGGWLYRIAANTASDYRRRAWFRNLFRRVELDEGATVGVCIIEDLEQRSARLVLERLLAKMSIKRSAALVLHEVEGYSTEEIAVLERVPVATVRTRLHHARKELDRLASELQRTEAT